MTMLDSVRDRRIPMPPQLAVRAAVLGVVAFALFTVIFFRLWYLQVLSGEQYLRQAQVNKVRTERIVAPRGEIKDRNGTSLVVNEQATIITLDPRKIPTAEKQLAAQWGRDFAASERRRSSLERARNARVRKLRREGRARAARAIPQVHVAKVPIPAVPAELRVLFGRLGRIVALRPSTIQERVILGLWLTPYAPVKIKTGVADDVRDYLYERPDQFPGVLPQQTYVRSYPFKGLAAQIFGTVGSISKDELGSGAYKGATAGEIVGQGGLEYHYDSDLRGRDGVERFLVDAQGNPKGSGRQSAPVAGRSLKLTLDVGLQQTGADAMATRGHGLPGGFVALNPRSGAVYALGSFPSYDPDVLAKPITQTRYDQIFSDAAGAPAVNRAITGAYPTGSTFKPISALAAMKAGLITPDTAIASPACVTIAKQKFCNAGQADLGTPNLIEALKISSDVYFYRVGEMANDRGAIIQRMARSLGLGHTTGIDIPGEFGGTLPDRKWRHALNQRELAYEKVHKNVCPPNCVYSDKREWTVGDNVQVAVGQGDIQATPLQMAVAYSAIANGGTVVRPHLGLEVDDTSGRLIRKIRPGATKHVKLDPGSRTAVMEGLHEAASAPGGTSTDVFRGWPQGQLPVYGKTGTAQRAGRPNDQSWYVAYVPGGRGQPPIVIAATVEDAGFGADAAAPVVCEMLSHWYRVRGAACAPGASHTR